MKRLTIFRLADRCGNKSSLLMKLDDDGVITYDLRQGYQLEGTPLSISNLQIAVPLPRNPSSYMDAEALNHAVKEILENDSVAQVERVDVLNELHNKKTKQSYSLKDTYEGICALAEEIRELKKLKS
jgi:hypothetical protein